MLKTVCLVAAVSAVMIIVVVNMAEAFRAPYDPGTMSPPVSPAEAMQSARAWAGDPELSLDLVSVLVPDEEGNDEPECYIMRSSDGQQEFWVDCDTGEVVHWESIPAGQAYAGKIRDHWDESTQMPVADLNSAVLQFLSSKYADFATLNMQQYNSQEPESAYVQRLPNGTWYVGNYARCSVDEWTGVVTDYWAVHRRSPTISPEPVVSGQQAEQIALNNAGTLLMGSYDVSTDKGVMVHPQSAFVLYTGGPFLGVDPLGAERLYWDIGVIVCPRVGYTAADYNQEQQTELGATEGKEVSTLVDANTGEVIRAVQSGYMGAGPDKLDKAAAAKIKTYRPDPRALKREPQFAKAELNVDKVLRRELSYPPLIIGDTGYLYAKYLPLLYGGTIGWSAGKGETKVAGRIVKVRPGTKVFEVGGKRVVASRAPVIVAGRLYVPPDVVRAACGAECRWDAKGKTLHITSKEVPLKSRGKRLPAPSVSKGGLPR